MKNIYIGKFNVEDGSGNSVRDWKSYVEREGIEGIKIKTGYSAFKHHKSITIEAPNKAAIKKIIKALKNYGINWPETSDFVKENNL